MNKWIYIGGGAFLLILILFVILPYFKGKKEEELVKKDDVYTATIDNQAKPSANEYITGVSTLINSISQFVDVSGIGKGGRNISQTAGSAELLLNQQVADKVNG